MVDEGPQEARYTIGDRVVVMGARRIWQTQRLATLWQGIDAEAGDTQSFELIVRADVLGQFLNAVLTTEAGQPLELTAAEVAQLPESLVLEVWQDFFTLNGSLGNFIGTWLLSTLKSSGATAASAAGADPSNGSI